MMPRFNITSENEERTIVRKDRIEATGWQEAHHLAQCLALRWPSEDLRTTKIEAVDAFSEPPEPLSLEAWRLGAIDIGRSEVAKEYVCAIDDLHPEITGGILYPGGGVIELRSDKLHLILFNEEFSRDNDCETSENLADLERRLYSFCAWEEWIENPDWHDVARPFMARHAAPGWMETSLEEWLRTYSSHLPQAMREEAAELLEKLPARGNTH